MTGGMMFKGTPRPWGIEKTKNDWWVGQIGPDGKVDLIVSRFPTGSEYSDHYTDRQKSDAMLVAAAPELLEALISIVDRSHNGELGSSKVIDMRKIAEEAVAKALGEQK